MCVFPSYLYTVNTGLLNYIAHSLIMLLSCTYESRLTKKAIPTLFFIVVATSASDLQPSTTIANQLFGPLVSTQVRTIGLKLFLIYPSINNVQDTDCITAE